MLLDMIVAHGLLVPEGEHATSIGDLIPQQPELLDVEAEDNGGLGLVLPQHYPKVYEVAAKASLSTLAGTTA